MSKSRLKKYSDLLIILIFFLITTLPLLDNAFLIDKVPFSDNRTAAMFPSFPKSINGVAKYFNEFELFYRDQFGFRNSLIRGYNLLYYNIFGQSGNSRVLVGERGWLYITDNNSVEVYRKTQQLNREQLEAWKYILENRNNWCRERGIDYLLVIAPDKHTIYPENMPRWIKPVGEISILDQVLKFLKNETDINVLDLRPALIEGKRMKNVYFPGDSHWNKEGAYIAYREIMLRLSEKYPNLKPYDEQDLEIKYLGEISQDLAAMLSLNPFYWLRYFTVNLSNQNTPVLSEDKILPSRFSYGVPLQRLPFASQTENSEIKAVFFRDSFFRMVIPYISLHFSRAVYYWQNEFDPEVVASENPQIVVQELVERVMAEETEKYLRKYRETKKQRERKAKI